MKIEVLYISECPNRSPAVETIREILREYQLPQQITEIKVTDLAQALGLDFPGSPTIRVNGKDVEPNLPELNSHGLTCRTYLAEGKPQGVPKREWIHNAVVAALRREDGSQVENSQNP